MFFKIFLIQNDFDLSIGRFHAVLPLKRAAALSHYTSSSSIVTMSQFFRSKLL